MSFFTSEERQEQIIITCNCNGNEHAEFYHWEVDEHDPNCFGLTVSRTLEYWSDRLRHIWGILTGGHYYSSDEVLMTKADAVRLRDWLDKMLAMA